MGEDGMISTLNLCFLRAANLNVYVFHKYTVHSPGCSADGRHEGKWEGHGVCTLGAYHLSLGRSGRGRVRRGRGRMGGERKETKSEKREGEGRLKKRRE